MAPPADLKKVLELKLQLKESSEGHTLVKTLKKLQELDITLEILAETGIGKVVNSFRKHDNVGQVAKTLVHRWKKLVPNPRDILKTEIQQTDQDGTSRASKNTACTERKLKKENPGPEHKLSKNGASKNKIPITDGKLFQPKEKTNSLHAERKDEGKHKVSDVTNKHRPETSAKGKNGPLKVTDLSKGKKCKREKKRKEKAAEMEKDLESDDSEMPSMSFEECLSYKLNSPKRKKRSCESRNPKRVKVEVKMDDSSTKSGKGVTEAPAPVVSKSCVMDLLNVPLPPVSMECDDLSQYQYFTEKKVEEKVSEDCEEAPVFTGQRLYKKMQVYSGSKVVYLPAMMTLYQQCIRTLQNNIDALYEIGGVPFEILEPVLERCTPEQLLRIEEYNPVYIGVTDHLWEKHCLRDFRSAQLEEYESWREMYLRLFEERERKFQELTKSIVSAHSGKPKGRQVKMAFVHSVAKPPRNVRIQQEIHGTAGPGLPHAVDKFSGRITESKGRPGSTEQPKPLNTGSGVGQPQDPRKTRRVAPMMAKSLKAFKKQFARR